MAIVNGKTFSELHEFSELNAKCKCFRVFAERWLQYITILYIVYKMRIDRTDNGSQNFD